jgi:hypothetical protein
MKKLAPVFLFLLCNSCNKQGSTRDIGIFDNITSHSIKVNAYLNGTIVPSSSFELLPNQSKEVFSFNLRGLSTGSLTFGRVKTLETDSFVVIFDDTYKIAHYRFNFEGNNLKKYLITSVRNIYNDASYFQTLISSSKYFRFWEAKYKFTEQDYLDAK